KSLIQPEVLSIKQEITPDDLREKFPNLHAEISDEKMQIKIDDVEGDGIPDETDSNLESADPFSNFEPSTMDYIHRAKTDKEAEEIISYSLKQGNITADEAEELLDQLSKKGVRSFGPIKTSGHYFRKAVESRNRQLIKKRYTIQK
ncbi:MAG: DUF2095 family protein, partial [Candidatus Hodarchaeales archaeon]